MQIDHTLHMPATDPIQLLKQFSCDLRDIDIGHHVDIITAPVDPVCFLRDFVSRNKPVLIQGALQHWAALASWSPEQLVLLAGKQQVSVDTTPNGLGDAVTASEHGDCFCIPHKQQMSFQEFVQLFFASREENADTASTQHDRVVPYLQVQSAAAASVMFWCKEGSTFSIHLSFLPPQP
jgi:hypothetical protein